MRHERDLNDRMQFPERGRSFVLEKSHHLVGALARSSAKALNVSWISVGAGCGGPGRSWIPRNPVPSSVTS